MAKATILLLFSLAIIATLLFGVNIGKQVERWQKTPAPTSIKKINPTSIPKTTIPTKVASESAIPKDNILYRNTTCGYEITYPKAWTKTDFDKNSITFTIKEASKSDKIAVVCAEEIPKPPIREDLIEEIELSSVSATLYHNSSPNDGAPLDEVITKIPGKNMEIFIAGFGKNFDDLLASFKFLQ